mgnify:CR=1 FL=1
MTDAELIRLADLVAARLGNDGVPRILLGRRDAARSLGMSTDTFAQLVAPHVGCVRRGTGGRGGGRAIRLYRVVDLDAWAAANATRISDDLPLRAIGA